jgi:Nif-specific regulatory protein
VPLFCAIGVAISGTRRYTLCVRVVFSPKTRGFLSRKRASMAKSEQFEPPLPEIIGSAPAMQEVYRLVRLAAPPTATVLLIGETGTGKEVIAKAVHKLSRRADGPFVRVNCGALHENLLESELFGHIKGSFTGAVENKIGRFEAAHGGTIFLDEINSTTPKLQVKLLRVLQEKEFERVGESRTIRVDVRVIAATNASLEQAVEEGAFREDLYYRLNVIPISLPPLRERRDDIPLLAQFFVKRYAEAHKCPVPELTPGLLDALKAHDWPGNVRELENTLERLIVFADGGAMKPDLLKFGRARPLMRAPRGGAPTDVPSLIRALVRAGMHAPRPAGVKLHKFLVDGVERELIEEALREAGDNRVRAAERLGMNRNTLHKKREEYRRADAGEPLPADEEPEADAPE